MTIFLIYIIGAMITSGLLTFILHYDPHINGYQPTYKRAKEKYGDDADGLAMAALLITGLFWFIILPAFIVLFLIPADKS